MRLMDPQTPDAITAILHVRAEKELKTEVEAAFEPARRISQECNVIPLRVSILGSTGASTVTVKCAYYELINAMMQAAFDYHLPDRKKAAVKSFLNRVDKLQSELDELRGSVQ